MFRVFAARTAKAGFLLATLFLVSCATAAIEFKEPSPVLFLQSIEAKRTTLGGGADQVYLLHSDGRRFPVEGTVEMFSGDVWQPELSFDVFEAGELSLYEYDALSSDDLIGSFQYNRSEPGLYDQTMTGDASNYRLVWEIRLVQTRR